MTQARRSTRCPGCPFSKRGPKDAATTFRASDIAAWVEGVDAGSPEWTCHSANDGTLCAGACGIPAGLEAKALTALAARWGPLQPPAEPSTYSEEVPF